jgi:DNA-directed RNA polymerase, mitochondrial
MHYNIVKSTNRRYLEELKNRFGDMPDVVNSINILQKTEWVINKEVQIVFNKCVDLGLQFGKLPINPNEIELPPKPIDIATNKEALIKWKRMASKVYERRAKNKSKHIQVLMIKAEAELLCGFDGFYNALQFCKRGRIYPKPAMLNMQSADYAKGLLKFKYGKRMGDNDSYGYFAIAGANLFGEVDKGTIQDRVQWIEKHEQKILSVAKTPFDDKWWHQADKPFQFLAWCMEYKNFAETDYDASFITTLPIQADCSNSGLQHYSAMMRDEVGGKATNLIDDEKPNDVYAIVAQRVIEKLKLRTDELSKKWLAYGIDRKICKKPVMCLPYSLTRYSCRMYLAEHVNQQLNERNISHNFGDDLFEATRYLTPVVWESIYETIQGARDIMKFLKTVSSLVSSENLPINWTTPLNFPVQMACYSMQSKRVKTKMGESILMLSYQQETQKIDKRKTSQSICANFIHSLDASVLQLAVVKAHQAGIDNFSVIHDSFGVVAPDTQIMAKAIRDSFCEIYSKDVLKNWADEMFAMLSAKNQRKFPTIPSKGNLDLEAVKNSKFFCI